MAHDRRLLLERLMRDGRDTALALLAAPSPVRAHALLEPISFRRLALADLITAHCAHLGLNIQFVREAAYNPSWSRVKLGIGIEVLEQDDTRFHVAGQGLGP